jgi:DNA-binding response OmpR family regulator
VIQIDSQPGSGTTVNIYLPAGEGARTQASELPSRQQRYADGHGERVVLVEDEEALRSAMERTLRDSNYDVVSFGDAESALAYITDQPAPPDLLVSDVVLPGQSGADLARLLRADHPQIAVLLVTGYTTDRLDDIDVQARFDVLEKPFGPPSLLARVEALLAAW